MVAVVVVVVVVVGGAGVVVQGGAGDTDLGVGVEERELLPTKEVTWSMSL